MIIDFEHMEEKKVENFKGGSGVLSMRAFDDGSAKIMLLTLAPGPCHYCPEGKHHCVINDSDGELTFFAVVPSFKK